MCQQGLFLKFHPLCAALCDPTDSQQKCDVKQTAVIDCRLKPVQRERNVSPHQGHGLCAVRSVYHCCMKHMALVCVCVLFRVWSCLYKVINNFSEGTKSTLWLRYVDYCNQHKTSSNNKNE